MKLVIEHKFPYMPSQCKPCQLALNPLIAFTYYNVHDLPISVSEYHSHTHSADFLNNEMFANNKAQLYDCS